MWWRGGRGRGREGRWRDLEGVGVFFFEGRVGVFCLGMMMSFICS